MALGDNKIFVTCDMSDLRTGTVLSWGPTWESTWLITFNSMQLKDAQKNYPVHKKEMLTIVWALKKWWLDHLGSQFIVYTDHQTLENFDTQKDLSHWQAWWIEHLSQFDMMIHYIHREDNTVADALSHLPADMLDEETEDVDVVDPPVCWNCWLDWQVSCNAILTISANKSFLRDVWEGYKHDEFCQKLSAIDISMLDISFENNLWYLGDCLMILRFSTLYKDLFHLTHDSLGHFGANTSYAGIRNCYYWLNMCRDLKSAYVPACMDCQHNKSSTLKARGPLHPLLILESHGNSVCLDFMGPLPENVGLNCILTVTNRLRSDVCLIPTWTDISAPKLALLFFNKWYCKNGLPLELITHHDKLFVSKFWKALHTLTGVHLKMSTAYHPQTNGASEHTNKMLNQCIHFHVEHNQKGWVQALPIIHFNIMNSVNGLTGFSGFQIQMGWSPHVIPPLVPGTLSVNTSEETVAHSIILQIETDMAKAKNALLGAKILQVFCTNKSCGHKDIYLVGNKVMLATLHHCQEFKAGDKTRVAKFFPHWDGPFSVTKVFLKTSSYSLHLPNSPSAFLTYHASLLKQYNENDASLFPSHKLGQPGLVMTKNGLEKYHIERIINEQSRGHGLQYLVWWLGYSESNNLWLPQRELKNCEALDWWKAGRAEVMQ